MKTYHKVYTSSDELRYRFGIFQENLRKIEKMQTQSMATYGVNEFADLTSLEFRSRSFTNLNDRKYNPSQSQVTNNKAQVPDEWDWRQKKVVGPVQSQGECSGNGLAIVEEVESLLAIKTQQFIPLSAKQLEDCLNVCDGVNPIDIWQYVMENGIQEAGKPVDCNHIQPVVNVTSYNSITTSNDESEMQQWCYTNGPFLAAVDAESWQFYSGGVIQASTCGNQIDHLVQVVGWTVMNGVTAWVVRNSWGDTWGYSGYCYVELGKNACGKSHLSCCLIAN